MEVLAIIPARGGSKGVPRKNLRLLLGKPLIAHTIEQSLQAKSVKRTVVSTEDAEIAATARQYGAEVILRPDDLATDSATSESALSHVLDYLLRNEAYEPDIIVFLQCTSPIRKPSDIDDAMSLFVREKGDSLVSVTPWHGFIWRRKDGEGIPENFDYQNRPRRQQIPEHFRENGSIFIFKPWILEKYNNRLGGKILLYSMDFWSGFEADTLEDFALCEWILQNVGLTGFGAKVE